MYIDLKLFRLEHNNMFQSDLGELFGVGQSVISRMEKQFAELNEVQYKKLCERFGEEEVQKYVRDSPLKNVMDLGNRRAKRKNRTTTTELQHETELSPVSELTPQEPSSDIAGLIAVVKNQQDEITRLNQRIADLTEIIIEKVYG